MIKKQLWFPLFVTFIFSLISFCILIISISTNHWINAQAKKSNAYKNSVINYGLFHGSVTRYILASGDTYDLTVTCNYHESACIYSCHKTADARQDELNRILKGELLIQCTRGDKSLKLVEYNEENVTSSIILNKSNQIQQTAYIRSGYWASTVSFLIITIIFVFISGIFSLINIFLNPIETVFSVNGLYIWNTICIIFTLLTLSVWGGLYNQFLAYNISITDTLTTENDSNGLASLGFSYFIIILVIFLHIGNIGIIFWRQYILDREIPPPTITIDKTDPTAIFY